MHKGQTESKLIFLTFWRVNMVEMWDFHLTETVSYEMSVYVCNTVVPNAFFVWHTPRSTTQHVPNEFIWTDFKLVIFFDTYKSWYRYNNFSKQDIMILELPMFRTYSFLFWVGLVKFTFSHLEWQKLQCVNHLSFTLKYFDFSARLLAYFTHSQSQHVVTWVCGRCVLYSLLIVVGSLLVIVTRNMQQISLTSTYLNASFSLKNTNMWIVF